MLCLDHRNRKLRLTVRAFAMRIGSVWNGPPVTGFPHAEQ